MAVSSGGNAVTLKQMNKTEILQTLLQHAPLTKTEIASLAKITFATVSNLLTELESDGLIRELGFADSHGGRKPLLYGINPSAYSFLGVDVQIERIICILADFEGKVLDSCSTEFDVELGPRVAVQKIRELAEQLLTLTNTSIERIAGIGVSTPGPIDEVNGVILSPPNMPGWKNVPFRAMVQQEFQVETYLEKDANAAAFGETRFGAGQGIQNLIYIMADIGIGGGIIFHGNIYRGFLNGAGEIGHMLMETKGPRCNCGNSGCLEAVASGSAIEKLLSGHIDSPGLHQVLREETTDAFAHEILSRAGRYLGLAISNVANLLNPEMIVLGGSLVMNSETYFLSAQTAARQHILPEFANRIRIERAKLNDFSGAIGAAMIAFHKNFAG
ncbi:MAG: hypothetical protein A2201_01205 [Alicyclobacillus sp. RIFOXYA1_FULL_53_8]|nr:MAG: hypothetical protein A2201_01205 [Alicyclobacillus sp. RIFOXYA1_FULL_53_8]